MCFLFCVVMQVVSFWGKPCFQRILAYTKHFFQRFVPLCWKYLGYHNLFWEAITNWLTSPSETKSQIMYLLNVKLH